jgi:hypothetical protein
MPARRRAADAGRSAAECCARKQRESSVVSADYHNRDRKIAIVIGNGFGHPAEALPLPDAVAANANQPNPFPITILGAG